MLIDSSQFSYSPDGFSVVLNEFVRKITWSEIEEITAYKRDLLTVDQIFLDIILKDTYITVTEDQNGWEEFLTKLANQFPSIDKGWSAKLALPAFETNPAPLYKKL